MLERQEVRKEGRKNYGNMGRENIVERKEESDDIKRSDLRKEMKNKEERNEEGR